MADGCWDLFFISKIYSLSCLRGAILVSKYNTIGLVKGHASKKEI
jgi:hypothetical protein